MEFLQQTIDILVHLDVYLDLIIEKFGLLTYLLLFVTIFCETGLVVTPFLPGDSLLFAAGTFAASGALNANLLFVILAVAAILGDTVNYWIGHRVGPAVFTAKRRWLNE